MHTVGLVFTQRIFENPELES